jgi:hypothetical protein
VIGRVLAALLACALVTGGAGAGFGEPRPAPRLLPAERLTHDAVSSGLIEHPTPVGPLTGVEALSSTPPALTGTSPVFSVGRDVPASPPERAVSPDHADALEPAGKALEGRSKP